MAKKLRKAVKGKTRAAPFPVATDTPIPSRDEVQVAIFKQEDESTILATHYFQDFDLYRVGAVVSDDYYRVMSVKMVDSKILAISVVEKFFLNVGMVLHADPVQNVRALAQVSFATRALHTIFEVESEPIALLVRSQVLFDQVVSMGKVVDEIERGDEAMPSRHYHVVDIAPNPKGWSQRRVYLLVMEKEVTGPVIQADMAAIYDARVRS